MQPQHTVCRGKIKPPFFVYSSRGQNDRDLKLWDTCAAMPRFSHGGIRLRPRGGEADALPALLGPDRPLPALRARPSAFPQLSSTPRSASPSAIPAGESPLGESAGRRQCRRTRHRRMPYRRYRIGDEGQRGRCRRMTGLRRVLSAGRGAACAARRRIWGGSGRGDRASSLCAARIYSG